MDGDHMDAPILVDLDRVESRERTALWSRAVPTLFPGMTVAKFRDEPTIGTVKGGPFGSAHFWEIHSGPVKVTYSPGRASPRSMQAFSLMLQMEGETGASQSGHRCSLRQGDFCLIDGKAPFSLQVNTSRSKILVMQLPRLTVLNRHPNLQRVTAIRTSSDEEAGARVLKAILLSIRGTASRLTPGQNWNLLSMLVHSLGLLEPLSKRKEIGWRVHRALGFIEARLSVPFLTADDIAAEQSVSRRQLDRIFMNEIGVTVTAQLWERRLQHAATLLNSNDDGASITVTQAALASGFQDASHFSRMFKKRFGVQPGKWRAHVEAGHEQLEEYFTPPGKRLG